MGGRPYRAHQRFAVDLEATVSATSRELAARARVVDLGLGGAACELDHPFRLGEIVSVQLCGSAPFLLYADIAWLAWAEGSKARIGLRFAEDDEPLVLELLAWLGVQDEVGSE